MTNLLFVYGTLLQSGNPIAGYITQNCTFIAAGKIKGVLYDIGEYPGMIINNKDEGYVYGNIYQLLHPQENLKIVDEYEGVGPEQERPNLYTREIRSIETTSGIVDAWVYIYNLSADGLPLIQSGNYTEYIAQKKSPGN